MPPGTDERRADTSAANLQEVRQVLGEPSTYRSDRRRHVVKLQASSTMA